MKKTKTAPKSKAKAHAKKKTSRSLNAHGHFEIIEHDFIIITGASFLVLILSLFLFIH